LELIISFQNLWYSDDNTTRVV